MRRYLLKLSILVLATGLLSACTGLAVISNAPFNPGDIFYPLQRFVEEEISPLLLENTSRTIYFLELSEKRTIQLANAQGTDYELAAFYALDKSLDQAVEAVFGSPQDLKPAINYRLIAVLENAYDALITLNVVPDQAPEAYQQLLDDILSVYTALAKSYEKPSSIDKQNSNQALPPNETIIDGTDNLTTPHTIEFPPGSEGAEHEFFPLNGKHAELACESCHLEGKFAGTPAQCQTCHLADKPVNHFSGECSACHTTQVWSQVNFDHTGVTSTNCQTCHQKDIPTNHFSGQCSACHNSENWASARFNHKAAGATNCQNCHSSDKPANHFQGQCSTCHITSSWQQVGFSHKGLTDCKSCHDKNKPGNHFVGQCSTCHNTNAWSSASINHSGLTDCQSCHSSDKPSNHYSGQCSTCHNTNAWGSASFNHNGQTDCQSCHSRPNNHYSGQCSACHSTSSWGSASFNHSGQTDCQSCHSRPNNHWSGQCSQCHNANSWGSISVRNHSFPINHKNADGNCANCHNSKSSSWTCYNCHDRTKMEEKHAEKNISDLASRCINCHPNGQD